jgi:hypothetical protein
MDADKGSEGSFFLNLHGIAFQFRPSPLVNLMADVLLGVSPATLPLLVVATF